MSATLVIDTSVFIAILFEEPDADELSAMIRTHALCTMAAANYVECAIVMAQRRSGRVDLDNWLQREAITITPVDLALARLASDAHARFGKGHHPAGLNFGDCFSYALAKALTASLLFKGSDFSKTDITPAVR